MGNGTHGQRGIVVNTAHRDEALWRMGHMGKGVLSLILEMGHLWGWGTWAMGQMVNICGHVLDHVQLP